MQLLDGKATSLKIREQIAEHIADGVKRGKRAPRLDVILVGDDFASEKYVSMKEKAAKEAGMEGVGHRLPKSTTTEELLTKIDELNLFDGVDGFLVQLPLPEHIDEQRILESIKTEKDVDGLTALNLGRLFQNDPKAIPSATPKGILLLLNSYNIPLSGKRVLIIGRSKFIGLPLSALMLAEDATVTIAHSKTENLTQLSKESDIIVSAVGKAGFITAEHVSEGAIVIDVGTNRDPQTGKLVGDVRFDEVAPLCSYITPVPGGVGPMTIASLMWNTLNIWRERV